MKYTFLMPAYKATFLSEAIKSILNQTHTDFQLIISDDCSPEGLKEIVDEFNDNRIIYRRNEKNIGAERLVDHWNLLLTMCESEWCIMASDDDVYAPNFLEELDKIQIKYPSADLLRSRLCIIDGNNEITFEEGLFHEYVDVVDFFTECHANTFQMAIGNYSFRTSKLKEYGGFVVFPYAWFSDNATVLMMGANGCTNTSDILFYFRFSGINISTRPITKKEAKGKVIAGSQYNQWFANITHSLESKCQNKLELNNVKFCKSRHFLHLFYQQKSHLLKCGFKDFFDLIRTYEYGFNNKLKLIFRYFKDRITQ